MNLSGEWIDRLRQRVPMKKIVLDMDSSVSETCGRQEATAYNGHFGGLESCLLREGNVHCAKDWKTVLGPIVARYRGRDLRRYFRGDVAFADPAIYKYLEAECDGYAIRIPANDILNREIGTLMTRPVGRPPRAPVALHHEFHYKAAAWDIQRRVIAKVEWTRLSCHDFIDNQVRLQLFVLACNLGSFFRQAALQKGVRHWTMTTLREKMIKIGAKVVCHARYIIFQIAEVAVSRKLFAAILRWEISGKYIWNF